MTDRRSNGLAASVNMELTSPDRRAHYRNITLKDIWGENIGRHLNRFPISVIEFQGPSKRAPRLRHLSFIALVGSIPVVANI